MRRCYKLCVQIAFLTAVIIVTSIVCACAIWHPADDRAATTGMFVIAQDVLIDPDSIMVDYEDKNIRRTSLCICSANAQKMIKSYARMHFLEHKELADVYYSRDGVHYEQIQFENSDDITNRAYHWMLSWLGRWE